jgi:hypothetical protein
LDSVRPDGSLPIDTNLATWTTTLSINALAAGGDDVAQLGCLDWLLSCQHRWRHPFTGAEPGGWGWSDLSGACPTRMTLRQRCWHWRLGATLRRAVLRIVSASIRRLARGSAGWPVCRTATAGGRRFAAAGAVCPSTAAAPT